MEANETIRIAIAIFLIVVAGIVFYMENRLRHYREYLSRYRSKYKERLNNQLDITDTGLSTGLNNSNIFDKNIEKNLKIMQNTLDKYKIKINNLKKLNENNNAVIQQQNKLIKTLRNEILLNGKTNGTDRSSSKKT